ncbi:hypothetical protein MKX01_025741 [Papaver californicum]|nr:hypothetical protein MKX01_025741 [Papaver californicum]
MISSFISGADNALTSSLFNDLLFRYKLQNPYINLKPSYDLHTFLHCLLHLLYQFFGFCRTYPANCHHPSQEEGWCARLLQRLKRCLIWNWTIK